MEEEKFRKCPYHTLISHHSSNKKTVLTIFSQKVLSEAHLNFFRASELTEIMYQIHPMYDSKCFQQTIPQQCIKTICYIQLFLHIK